MLKARHLIIAAVTLVTALLIASTEVRAQALAPDTPAGFKATVVSATQIDVTWDAATANTNGYQIGYSVNANFDDEVSTALANDTSFSATNLTPKTTYYFRVRAKNIYSAPLGYTSSDYTATIAATTPDVAPTTPVANATPSVPINFTATVVSSTQIDLDWDASANANGYQIGYSVNANFDNEISTGLANVTNFSATKLAPNTKYYFRVRAKYIYAAPLGYTPSSYTDTISATTALTTTTPPPPATPPPTTTPPPIDTTTDAWYTQHIIAQFTIGNSSVVDADRRVGWNIKSQGWAGFVATNVKPVLNWGARRIELHLPFGCNKSQDMDFDGYLEAKAAGLTWLTDGFAEAWAPVIRGDYTNGEKVEVIAYNGSIRSDMNMKALLCVVGAPVVDCVTTGNPIVGHITQSDGTFADDAGNVLGKVSPVTGEYWDSVHVPARLARCALGGSAWQARVDASMVPFLAAGVSIGIDGAVAFQKWHPGYAYVRKLQAQGIRTYIETWPDTTATRWADTNIIIASNTWYSRWFMFSGWPMRRPDLSGELIRLITIPGITTGFDSQGNPIGTTTKTITNADGTTSNVAMTWADFNYGFDEATFSLGNNYSVMLPITNMISQGYTLKQICDGARAVNAALP